MSRRHTRRPQRSTRHHGTHESIRDPPCQRWQKRCAPSAASRTESQRSSTDERPRPNHCRCPRSDCSTCSQPATAAIPSSKLTWKKAKTFRRCFATISIIRSRARLLHADFLKISLTEPVDVEVPFETFGKCKGVVEGGVLHVVFRRLPVRCLPDTIPVKLTHDVTELDLDGHVAAKDLPMPDGVSLSLAAQSNRDCSRQ